MNNVFKTDDESNLGFWCEQRKVTISRTSSMTLPQSLFCSLYSLNLHHVSWIPDFLDPYLKLQVNLGFLNTKSSSSLLVCIINNFKIANLVILRRATGQHQLSAWNVKLKCTKALSVFFEYLIFFWLCNLSITFAFSYKHNIIAQIVLFF